MTLAELDANPLVQQKHARKSHTVYQDLKRRILLGSLTDKCPITEQALAQEYSCSQGTIREALLSLQQCGLVDRRGYQGTYVTRTTFEEAVFMAGLRFNLECAGVDGAITAMTEDKMHALRTLVTAYEESRAKRDVFTCSEIDRVLHLVLFETAGMPTLEPILQRTLLQLHRYMISRHQGSFAYTQHEDTSHTDILNAVEEGDVTKARELIKRHINLTLLNLAPDVQKAAFANDVPTALVMQMAITA